MKACNLILFFYILFCSACESVDPELDESICESEERLSNLNERNFGMGFTTWPYGATSESVENTYSFISKNASIYAEHLDNKIPWDSWIKNEPLPEGFLNDVTSRKQKRVNGLDLLLSVSVLNSNRTNIIEDYQGNIPEYQQLDDPAIVNAYVAHLNYLIDQLEPDYLIISIESNELLIKTPSKWPEFKRLMKNVKSQIAQNHPNLPLSESITLHNWYAPEVENPDAFIDEIQNYISDYDFAAISFYPFFKGQKTSEDFQLAFDFLHENTNKTIAFVETTMIAEDLEVSGLNLAIDGNECSQKIYLESLLLNAEEQDYEFIIWWAHRDYDALWETFDESIKDLGKIWRDTGLLDEEGNERQSYKLWQEILAM